MIKKTIILWLVLLTWFTLVWCTQKSNKSTIDNDSSGSVSCSINPSNDKSCRGENIDIK